MIDFESFLNQYKSKLSDIFNKYKETNKSLLKRGYL